MVINFVTFGEPHTHTLEGVSFTSECIATYASSDATEGLTLLSGLFSTDYALHRQTFLPGEQNAEAVHPDLVLSDYPRGKIAVPPDAIEAVLNPPEPEPDPEP